MLNFDYNHLCFFAGVLHDEMYHQNDFFGSMIQQTENHRGVMISAVLPKSSPPYDFQFAASDTQKNHSGDISHPVEHLQKRTSDYNQN